MADPNYNLIKFIRRCIYQMKREYGGPIQINILADLGKTIIPNGPHFITNQRKSII